MASLENPTHPLNATPPALQKQKVSALNAPAGQGIAVHCGRLPCTSFSNSEEHFTDLGTWTFSPAPCLPSLSPGTWASNEYRHKKSWNFIPPGKSRCEHSLNLEQTIANEAGISLVGRDLNRFEHAARRMMYHSSGSTVHCDYKKCHG